MTYGVVAILLLILAVAWYVCTGRSDKRVEDILACIESGDEQRFTALLKAAPQVVESVSDVTFLLLHALLKNRPAMVQELLDCGHSGAEIQACAREHEADLLTVAIDCADAEALRMLLIAGIKENGEAAAPVLSCYVSGKPEHLRVLEMFEATGITPKQNEHAYTPLHVAAVRFSENAEAILAMIKPLLEAGADVNAMSACGNTPLDMAKDKTHVGAGDADALVELLLSYGARSGRSMRVPKPCYTGRVYFDAECPQLPQLDLPQGVKVLCHNIPAEDLPGREVLEEHAVPSADVDRLQAHRAYMQLTVTGQEGEDPLAVAERGLAVLVRLYVLPGMVGVQFEDAVIVAPDVLKLEDSTYNPMLYTMLRFGRTEDSYILVNTCGLANFGLREIELVVNSKVLKKKRTSVIADMISDLGSAAVTGGSAWEPGHTATLGGMFCHIGYGKHTITEKEGFVFVVEQP